MGQRQFAKVILYALKLPKVSLGDRLDRTLFQCLSANELRPMKGDVLAVASKVVSMCEGRIVNLSRIRVSGKAKRIAKRWMLNGALAEIVLREADVILGGVPGFLLTMKNGFLTANAGVDLKNSPEGTATLWPTHPDNSARALRLSLEREYHVPIGVEIVDSHVTPLRLGTVGLAIGLSGFSPIRDDRGHFDLYGRKVKVTRLNIADDIAGAAQMLMGEASERIGAVLTRNVPIKAEKSGNSRAANFEPDECLIVGGLMKFRKGSVGH